jgi:hypothetical protein
MPTLVPWGPDGLVIPEDVWSADPSTRTTLTASATPHTAGAWVSAIAALDHDAGGLAFYTDDTIAQPGVDTSMLVDIAVGATSSERIVVADLVVGGVGANAGPGWLELPLYVPRGEQISVRNRAAQVSDAITCKIQPLRLAHRRPARRCTTYGANQAGSSGTAITPATNAWGSWTQIVASTTAPARYLLLTAGQRAGDLTFASGVWYFQIAVGAAASERIIVPMAGRYLLTSNEAVNWGAPPLTAVDIPTGSRLAVRAWGPSTGNDLAVCIHAFD